MTHGYLGDGYGKDGWRDPDGGRDDSGRGDWRDEDRGNSLRNEWRGSDRYTREERGGSDGDGFMFEGGSRDRDRDDERGHDRGFFSRTADEVRDWFRDDEGDYRPRREERGGGSSGANRYDRSRGSNQQSAFSSGQHDHYLSWRQQQMDALDRDYQDYCQERQQQFHSDFDTWRRNRQSRQPQSGSQAAELELSERDELAGTTASHSSPVATTSPEGAATLGTNNSENSVTGRS
jgi:hypothetical protein